MKSRGNRPKHGVLVAEADGWELYLRVADSSSQWQSLKLVHPEPTDRKANYWLGWNGERLAKNADAACLSGHRPRLYSWVVERLTDGSSLGVL